VISRIAAITLILTTVVVIFVVYANSRDSILVKELAYICGAAIALGLTAFAVLSGKSVRSDRLGPKLIIPFLLILFWMGLTHFMGVRSVNAPYLFYSIIALGAITVSMALVIDERWRDRILSALLVSSALLSIYAILQSMSVNLFIWDAALNRSGRVSGSLGNPNLLGSFICAIIPVGVCFIASRSISRLLRGLSISLFAVLGCFALAASGTRGSLIGLAAGMFFIAGFLLFRPSGQSKVKKAVIIGSLLLLLTIAIVLMAPRLSEISHSDSGTIQVRRLIWSGTLDMIRAKPLTGWGPGSFQIVFPGFRNPVYHMLGVSHNTLHAHSEYLEVLSDTGLTGALLWLVLGVMLIRFWRKRLQRNLVTVGLLAGIVAIAAEATVSVALRWPPTAFLAALLVGLLMVSTDSSPAPLHGLRKRTYGAVAAAVAVLLLFAIPRYTTRLEAGRHLFMGKDIYLARVESEMNRAMASAANWQQSGNEQSLLDAVRWWATASSTTDSSIARCRLAAEMDDEDLGAWYALGSAALTKAILVQPQDITIICALEEMGIQAVDSALAVELTLDALAAYDSLARMAPIYAELHNNLALAYTRLGRLDDAFTSLRRSYELFGHRRGDYDRQVRSLLPLKPANHDGWHVIWQVLQDEALFSIAGDERRSERLSSVLEGNLWFTGLCLLMDPDHTDSLLAALHFDVPAVPEREMELLNFRIAAQADAVRNDLLLLSRFEEHDTAGMMEEVAFADPLQGVILPARNYILGSLLLERGDSEGLSILYKFGFGMICGAEPFVSRWPGGCDHLDRVLEFTLDAGIPPDLDDYFFSTVIQLLVVDQILYTDCRLALEDFRKQVDPLVASALTGTWARLGGPRHAFYFHDGEMPWSPGSVLEDTAERLELLSLENPDDPYFSLLEIRFYYILYSSLWWETPVFRELQHECITESLIESRIALNSLVGEENAVFMVNSALSGESDRTRMWVSSNFTTLLDRFRSDVTHYSGETYPSQPR